MSAPVASPPPLLPMANVCYTLRESLPFRDDNLPHLLGLAPVVLHMTPPHTSNISHDPRISPDDIDRLLRGRCLASLIPHDGDDVLKRLLHDAAHSRTLDTPFAIYENGVVDSILPTLAASQVLIVHLALVEYCELGRSTFEIVARQTPLLPDGSHPLQMLFAVRRGQRALVRGVERFLPIPRPKKLSRPPKPRPPPRASKIKKQRIYAPPVETNWFCCACRKSNTMPQVSPPLLPTSSSDDSSSLSSSTNTGMTTTHGILPIPMQDAVRIIDAALRDDDDVDAIPPIKETSPPPPLPALVVVENDLVSKQPATDDGDHHVVIQSSPPPQPPPPLKMCLPFVFYASMKTYNPSYHNRFSLVPVRVIRDHNHVARLGLVLVTTILYGEYGYWVVSTGPDSFGVRIHDRIVGAAPVSYHANNILPMDTAGGVRQAIVDSMASLGMDDQFIFLLVLRHPSYGASSLLDLPPQFHCQHCGVTSSTIVTRGVNHNSLSRKRTFCPVFSGRIMGDILGDRRAEKAAKYLLHATCSGPQRDQLRSWTIELHEDIGCSTTGCIMVTPPEIEVQIKYVNGNGVIFPNKRQALEELSRRADVCVLLHDMITAVDTAMQTAPTWWWLMDDEFSGICNQQNHQQEQQQEQPQQHEEMNGGNVDQELHNDDDHVVPATTVQSCEMEPVVIHEEKKEQEDTTPSHVQRDDTTSDELEPVPSPLGEMPITPIRPSPLSGNDLGLSPRNSLAKTLGDDDSGDDDDDVDDDDDDDMAEQEPTISTTTPISNTTGLLTPPAPPPPILSPPPSTIDELSNTAKREIVDNIRLDLFVPGYMAQDPSLAPSVPSLFHSFVRATEQWVQNRLSQWTTERSRRFCLSGVRDAFDHESIPVVSEHGQRIDWYLRTCDAPDDLKSHDSCKDAMLNNSLLLPLGVSTFLNVLRDDVLQEVEGLVEGICNDAIKGTSILAKEYPEVFHHMSRHGTVTRTKMFFGARYLWTEAQLKEDDSSMARGIRTDVAPLPNFAMDMVFPPLLERGAFFRDDFEVNQVAINVYHTGSDGIGPHFDDESRFTLPVVTLRIFSDSRLSFGCRGAWGVGNGVFAIPMFRNSALVLHANSYASNGVKHSVRSVDMSGRSGVIIFRQVKDELMEIARRIEMEEASQKVMNEMMQTIEGAAADTFVEDAAMCGGE